MYVGSVYFILSSSAFHGAYDLGTFRCYPLSNHSTYLGSLCTTYH